MRSKTRKALLLCLWILLFCSSCLNFGPDEETSHPTQSQITRAQKVMHLNPQASIQGLGLKLLGSGIDNAIWFKFTSPVSDLKDLFQSPVDVQSFTSGFRFDPRSDLPGWWDPDEKVLTGGTVELPNGRYMYVGAVPQDNGFLVYIFWHET